MNMGIEIDVATSLFEVIIGNIYEKTATTQNQRQWQSLA